MAKTVILGNNNSSEMALQLDATLIEVPDIYENDFGKVNDFVLEKLNQDFDILVIDADNIQRPDVALALGMFLRLSVMDLGVNALVPIIIASDKRIKSFLHIRTYSQLFLTKNVYFQPRKAIILEAVSSIDTLKYKDDFLDLINIPSSPETGGHSLANQWGASVLDRVMNSGVPSQNETLNSVKKDLYFKYVFLQTIDVGSFLSNKQQPQYLLIKRPPIDAHGKKILLIDDEADKGWEFVLKQLIRTNEDDFVVIKRKMKNYDSFTPEERNRIKTGYYDLIFLDLRVNGAEEENTYKPEEFSGMKILKQIKKENSGTQVIMFTASNKAWNLKALLDAGADGYYIKESPEYKFTLGFSGANYESLRNNIINCLNRSYLKTIDSEMKSIQRTFNITNTRFLRSVINQFAVSFALLRDQHFEFAFISLYQAIELVNDEYLERDNDGTWYIVKTNEDAKSWKINLHKECEETAFSKDDKKKFPEWKKIASLYYQLWKGTDKSFGCKLRDLIQERNAFMHNECDKNSKIHSAQGYLELFDVMKIICSYL